MIKKELLTVDEVAGILRTTPNTVYRWLRSGKLSGVKIGKEWRIDKTNFEAMLNHTNIAQASAAAFLDKIDPIHDHVMVVTTSSEALYDLEADYFKMGLARGHRLFKGCWWQHPDDVRLSLEKRGLPVQELESKNSLVVVDLNKNYLASGLSAPVNSWADEAFKTVNMGYKTMWGSGSPNLLSCGGSVSGLIDFESTLHRTLKDLPVVGICPYIFEDCIKDFFEPFIDLVNHHNSVIFYSPDKASHLKH
jgi:excisionase family DNA binding protein